MIEVKTSISVSGYETGFCFLLIMEAPMATHDHVTDVEDVAFDKTMKIAGFVLALLVIAVLAFWYLA